MPHGYIVVIKKDMTVDGSAFPLVTEECLLGRGHHCDIRILIPFVSREHARISVKDGVVYLTGISKNSTWLAGCALEKDELVELKHKDVFIIGNRRFRWESLTSSNVSSLTLREISSTAIIKYGLGRYGLPTCLIDELDVLDKIIKSEMIGEYINIGVFFYETKLSIGWSCDGEWTFTLGNQEEMKVKRGVTANLGLDGGELFSLVGRKVMVEDYTLDLKNRKLRFYGTCSSSKAALWRSFRSTFSFRNIGGGLVTIATEVARSGEKVKMKKRSFKSAYAMSSLPDISLGDDSYLDSSVDLDEYLNVDFEASSDESDLEIFDPTEEVDTLERDFDQEREDDYDDLEVERSEVSEQQKAKE